MLSWFSRSQTPSRDILPSYVSPAIVTASIPAQSIDFESNIRNAPQQNAERDVANLIETEKSNATLARQYEHTEDVDEQQQQQDNDYSTNAADQLNSEATQNYSDNRDPVNEQYELGQQQQPLQYKNNARYPNQQYEYNQSVYEVTRDISKYITFILDHIHMTRSFLLWHQTNQQYQDDSNGQYGDANQLQDPSTVHQTDDNYNAYEYGAGEPSVEQPHTFRRENENDYEESFVYGQQGAGYRPSDPNYPATNDDEFVQQTQQQQQHSPQQHQSQDFNPTGEYEYQQQQPQENVNYDQINARYDESAYDPNVTAYQQPEATNYQYSATEYQQQPQSEYVQESSDLQPQYSQDNYYAVEPGENYYNDPAPNASDMTYPTAYADTNVTNTDYYTDLTANNAGNPVADDATVESNYAYDEQQQQQQTGGDESSHTNSTTYTDNVQQQQQQQQQHEHEQTQFANVNNRGDADGPVPNYLHSDAEESVTTNSYPNQMQNDESDFDFSVKS